MKPIILNKLDIDKYTQSNPDKTLIVVAFETEDTSLQNRAGTRGQDLIFGYQDIPENSPETTGKLIEKIYATNYCLINVEGGNSIIRLYPISTESIKMIGIYSQKNVKHISS